MDKEEYKIKLGQINELADEGDFKGAADITDSIDWRHVKSVRTLCMVSEIYEANRRYEDSIRVLKFAYRRSSISRTVLYRLVELSLKTKNMDEAEDYYGKYQEISPNDSSKYILKYKIMRAKGAPLSDQIEILKTYKDNEYTERWAYELARLFKENGQNRQCINECDDMILWFSEGKFVTKAMELKLSLTNLTPEQQKKFETTNLYRSQSASAGAKANRSVASNAAAAPSVAAYIKPEAEMVTASPVKPAAPSIPAEEAISKMNQAAQLKVPVASSPTEEVNTPSVSPDVRKAFSASGDGKIQNQLASSIRAVFAGIQEPGEETVQTVAPPQIPEEESANDDVKTYNIGRPEDLSQYNVKKLEPESVAGGAVKTSPVKPDSDTHQMTLDEVVKPKEEKNVDIDAIFAETKNSLAQEVASGDYEKTDEIVDENIKESPQVTVAKKADSEAAFDTDTGMPLEPEFKKDSAAPEVQMTEDMAADAKDAAEEKAAAAADAKVAAEEKAAAAAATAAVGTAAAASAAAFESEADKLYGKETDESLGLTREFNFHDELKKAINSGEGISDAAKQVSAKAEEEAKAARESTQPVPFSVGDAKAEAELLADNSEDVAKLETEADLSELSSGTDEIQTTEESKSIIDHIMEEPETVRKVDVEPRQFDDTEEKIFTYFSKIPGISQQVTKVIADVHNNAGDKTSRSGNILMIGRQGSGKTSLADALIVGICKDLNIKAAKIAHIVADDLNKKDPAQVVSKMAGGFLVIEGAGSMTDETIDKLSRALEFRTDDLIIILEDEKNDLLSMLSLHPQLEEKFTSSVTIPVLTNDELVTFAKTYTKELGYKMDEMGVLALYTMIGDNQKDSEPVTIGKVKGMVDTAVARSSKGGRKLSRKFSKNSIDPSGRILLHEKDFDF